MIHSEPRLIHSVPRLIHSVPRLIHSVPRLIHSVPRLIHSVPRLIHSLHRLIHNVPRLIYSVHRLIHCVPRLIHTYLLVGEHKLYKNLMLTVHSCKQNVLVIKCLAQEIKHYVAIIYSCKCCTTCRFGIFILGHKSLHSH